MGHVLYKLFLTLYLFPSKKNPMVEKKHNLQNMYRTIIITHIQIKRSLIFSIYSYEEYYTYSRALSFAYKNTHTKKGYLSYG